MKMLKKFFEGGSAQEIPTMLDKLSEELWLIQGWENELKGLSGLNRAGYDDGLLAAQERARKLRKKILKIPPTQRQAMRAKLEEQSESEERAISGKAGKMLKALNYAEGKEEE